MPSVRPKVYRAMKKDADDKPKVDQTAAGLGVMVGTDINTNAAGNVVLDDNGVSVAPGWRDQELHRTPVRPRRRRDGGSIIINHLVTEIGSRVGRGEILLRNAQNTTVEREVDQADRRMAMQVVQEKREATGRRRCRPRPGSPR